jgi:hypothetical protein
LKGSDYPGPPPSTPTLPCPQHNPYPPPLPQITLPSHCVPCPNRTGTLYRLCYSEAMATSPVKLTLHTTSPKKTWGPENEIVAEQDRSSMQLTSGTDENLCHIVPFARRRASGTDAAICGPGAATSGPRAETNGTTAEAYGKPSGTTRPIRNGVKRRRPAKQTPWTSSPIPPSGIRISSSLLKTKSPAACCPPPPRAGYSRSCSS